MRLTIEFRDYVEERIQKQRFWRMLATYILGVVLMLMVFGVAFAQEWTDEQIVAAIYKAEGGAKATYAYGIRSVKYSSISEARRICFNTVRNNRKRFSRQTAYADYIEFLGSRYCPVSAHKLNKHWVKNVNFYLKKGE